MTYIVLVQYSSKVSYLFPCNGYMLWTTQPDDELKDKGHDEDHSQSEYSIFHHIFNNRHYQKLLTQTGKFAFCARKIFFPLQFARMEKPSSHLLPYEMVISSARLIGRCAHGSLLVHGRSSARTTYSPVWLLTNPLRQLVTNPLRQIH